MTISKEEALYCIKKLIEEQLHQEIILCDKTQEEARLEVLFILKGYITNSEDSTHQSRIKEAMFKSAKVRHQINKIMTKYSLENSEVNEE
jgi:hypothetical protein